jgi:hypothetical protein
MLGWARRQAPSACAAVHRHFHDVLPRHLPSGSRSFVVLREPCARFASAYDFVRAKRRDPRDAVHRFADGADGAAAWAAKLLREARYRRLWSQHTTSGSAYAGNTQGMFHMMAWQQAAWVANSTMVVCLPNMHSGVQAILDEHAPGCTLPAKDVHKNVVAKPATPALPTPTLCRLVERLYAADVALWQARCANATLPVRDPRRKRGEQPEAPASKQQLRQGTTS